MDPELGEINQRAEKLNSADNSATAISDEIADSNGSSNKKRSVVEDEEVKMEKKDKRSSHVIDIDSNSFVGENQRVCRICHLNAKESGNTSADLMELGCGCKGELGVAHLHCAEAWFRVRGNRLCEICSQTAKNIAGVGDMGFIEEWSETQSGESGATAMDGSRRCLRGQPLCNFLMACLVIAFVLPWFFRVNMF